MRLSKLIKKALIIGAAACMAFSFSIVGQARSKIEDPNFTQSSARWDLGTGVTCYIKEGVLYFEGNGVIPDYTNDTLYKRPYHTSIIGAVNVGAGITEIGTRAFAEFPYLRYINVYSTTFIKDANAFHKIDSKPMLRINGKNVATKMIGGKIPFTSLESWERIAQYSSYNIEYVVDDEHIKKQFRQSVYPDIKNVQLFYNEDVDAPNHLYEKDKSNNAIRTFTSPLSFAPGSNGGAMAVTSKIIKPSDAYLQAIANYLNVMPGYNYGITLSNAVTVGDTYYDMFPDQKKYVLNIPSEVRGPGRSYKLIIAWDGGTAVLDDLDSDPNTYTFATNAGRFSYSIVYTTGAGGAVTAPAPAVTSAPVSAPAVTQPVAPVTVPVVNNTAKAAGSARRVK